ncbi:MAG: ABC transporter ATP-binding protein [Proteobacteria bacterium]|nr:ABC transporter ATP-binding protein [Pseudomonadota bacterium]
MNTLLSLKVYGDLRRVFPVRSALSILLLPLATFAEGIALLLLIPLIDLFSDSPADIGEQARFIHDGLMALGLPVSVTTLLALFVGVGLLSALLTYGATLLVEVLKADAEYHLRRRFFNALMDVGWTSLARGRVGGLVKTALEDAAQAASGFVSLLGGIGTGLSVLVYIGLAIYLSAPLTVLVLLFGLVAMPLYLRFLKGGQQTGGAAAAVAEDLGATATELIASAKLLFSQGQRPYAKERFQRLARAYCLERQRIGKQTASMRLAFETTAVVFVTLLLVVLLVVTGESVGLALVFLAIFYRLAPRFSTIQSQFFEAISRGAWYERWRDHLGRLEASSAPRPGGRSPTFEEGLLFDRVSFRYGPDERWVVEDAALALDKGKCVAVMGASGEGKSTIVDLITGLLDPESGKVRVDGVDLRQIDREAWQHRIGVVLQDSPLLHMSVAENVAFGLETSEARLREACGKAGALGFIESLPEKFDTVIGERGSRLSGGQRQRLALARALYRDPWLLVLDEATSGLDAASETAVVDALRELKGSLTMLVVAHTGRLLELADTTYDIRDGRLEPRETVVGAGL